MDITNTTKTRIPNISFKRIKNTILGSRYDVSLVFIGERRARALSERYKGRAYNANILSFPVSETSGEIFINTRKAKHEAKKFGHTFKEHVLFLFVHGCLHLAGFEHGKEMEIHEQKLMHKFKIN